MEFGKEYIKTFDAESEYLEFKASSSYNKPNVSYVDDDIVVHYDPYVNVRSMTVETTTLSLKSGQGAQIVVDIEPEDATNKSLICTSSDESVATVDDEAYVTTVGGGNATITVETVDGGFSGQCDVKVIGNNAIIYIAPSKLSETTDSGATSGLHTNAFSGSSGKLTILSHTFENGVGTIQFNDDVTTIGEYAFFWCTSLTSIDIPNSVTSIGSDAFNRCYALTSIDIPNSVTNIGYGMFTYCSGLTSVRLPNEITSIPSSMFSNCSGLTSVGLVGSGASVEIPSGVTIIDNYAFQFCSGLTSVNIPDGVTSIGQYAFASCTGLTSIGLVGSGASFEIPNSITSIDNFAFSKCSSLTSVNIPNSVTSIGSGMCSDCFALTSVTIPNGITSIGGNTFYRCGKLTTINIPSGVTSIGNYAFYQCSGMTSMTCNATTAPTIQSATFRNIKSNGTLYVPIGSSGYNVWMGTSNYYLGSYGWTKVEQ